MVACQIKPQSLLSFWKRQLLLVLVIESRLLWQRNEMKNYLVSFTKVHLSSLNCFFLS